LLFNDDQIEANLTVSEDVLTISGEDEGEEYQDIYSKDSRTRTDIAPLCPAQKNKQNSVNTKFKSIFK
jgi:hypothetical protein